ncbi:MAG: metalloregulator ArsR/SmtB family transcription factor [Acidobacteria bacterium]|nr:metalloregulator ArsR/SmtB family transcription factor [Acidobacteriota bacterium]
MKTASLDTLEQLFKALADDTRLRILALLASGEVCVCNIHGALDLPQPAVSRHLAYLRKSGLVAARRDGLWMHYRLEVPANPAVSKVLKASLEAVHLASGTTTDRRRLSGLVSIPIRTLSAAAESCCKG